MRDSLSPAFDPEAVLRDIEEATDRLVLSAADLSDSEIRAPSLLPGWSRGHVLSHVAGNANGARRLLQWARTGLETPEYATIVSRAEEIETWACRSAAELMHHVRDSARRFTKEYALMPAIAWQAEVRWTSGQAGRASEIPQARLAEVLIHHADLDCGFRACDWPNPFSTRLLADLVEHLSDCGDAPAARMCAIDLATCYEIRGNTPILEIRGTHKALLAWILGWSRGEDLATSTKRELPRMPPL